MVNRGILIGVVAVVIIALIALIIYKRRANKSLYPKVSEIISEKSSSAQNATQHLSSTSINQGQKEECAVLALRIRNLDDINSTNSNAQESIKILLTKARSVKASVFEQRDFKMMVIPSSAAKDNLSLLTAKLTNEIEGILSEHNKKYSQKIDYGLGSNIGELIVEKVEGKYKFNSIGNTIQLAKRIADSAKSEALISESVRNKAMNDIKVEKKGEYWVIHKIIARDAHAEFINKFMQRQRQG